MIGIIDYGSGNVRAILNIYRALEIEATVVSTSAQVASVDRLVLPGVGSFDQAVNELDRSGMRAALDQRVLEDKTPILGICVGMQLFADSSEEGKRPGLGWIGGTVRKFVPPADGTRLELPHMGWNDVAPTREHAVFEGLDLSLGYYFLHSYYYDCAQDAHALARTTYGAPFACAVQAGHIVGVQFHPEKSHEAGVGLLRNFAERALC